MRPLLITKAMLDQQIDWLNKASGGDYSLDWAYGGVQIACAGGSHIVSARRGTKREAAHQLWAMREAVIRYKARMAHVVMQSDEYEALGRRVAAAGATEEFAPECEDLRTDDE